MKKKFLKFCLDHKFQQNEKQLKVLDAFIKFYKNEGFFKKILSKLDQIDDVEVQWVCDSRAQWWLDSYENVDWVIIATPNEFHYEQAKHFLQKGINVFCEKPGTLSGISLDNLISISHSFGAKLYIDDVLSHQDTDANLRTFSYKKWGRFFLQASTCC